MRPAVATSLGWALLSALVLPAMSDDDIPASLQDLVDHRGTPTAMEDWSFVPFSDQGSWQGYALPPDPPAEQVGAFAGTFSGPFLFAEGRWLGPGQARLTLRDAETDEPLGLHRQEAFSHPGGLRQSFVADNLTIQVDLWFHSVETALVRATIHNRGAVARTIELAWSGEVFEEAGGVAIVDGRPEVRTAAGTSWRVTGGPRVAEGRVEGARWTLPLSHSVRLQPEAAATLHLALSSAQAGDRLPAHGEIARVLETADASWEANRERWSRYLEAVTLRDDKGEASQVLANKALLTLVNNWRGPAGRLRSGGLFPSSNAWYFNGFWAWDSWKHAVALARFDPELAQDQIRAMFDHQDEHGMIADVVYLDPAEDNWRDTKPPLAGWAIEAVYRASDDLGFVRDLYPRLVEYHRFWYADRDHDGDGLCEYGSTDGTIEAARWESGMDNAVRFDETTMLQNNEHAWSMSQESVDLNSYLYREKLALAELATALGRDDEAGIWRSEAATLRDRIRESMFDQGTGWYYDIDLSSGEIVPVQGPEGWTPLWTGVASPEEAARARTTMLDPQKFRTHVPFPTVARDDPGFSEGYWRGLVWLDQVYFAIEGLRRYGFEADAEDLVGQLFANLDGATEPGAPLWENYNALTGEGRNVKHFSWSAAHLLLLALGE